jgi:hypothetical protein
MGKNMAQKVQAVVSAAEPLNLRGIKASLVARAEKFSQREAKILSTSHLKMSSGAGVCLSSLSRMRSMPLDSQKCIRADAADSQEKIHAEWTLARPENKHSEKLANLFRSLHSHIFSSSPTRNLTPLLSLSPEKRFTLLMRRFTALG